MQNVLDVFSKELRRQCTQRGSIAQLCKATGINRQQFNKYLAGQILPSVRNMRKICGYLGVTEAQLLSSGQSFESPRQSQSQDSSYQTDAAIDLSVVSGLIARRLGTALSPHAEGMPAPILPEGSYDCYVPLFAGSHSLVRWLLHVRRVGEGLTFSCRTYLRRVGEGNGHDSRNKYHGVGICGTRETYLIGTSRMQFHQPGILAIKLMPAEGDSYFTGLAFTPRLEGPVAISAALRFRGASGTPREVLSGLGIVRLSDPALDPVIAKLMRAVPASDTNLVQPINGKGLRSAALIEGPRDGIVSRRSRLAV